jgi:hypothetical protein
LSSDMSNLRRKIATTDAFTDNSKWKLAFAKMYFFMLAILLVACGCVVFALVLAFSRSYQFPTPFFPAHHIDTRAFQVSILLIMLTKMVATLLGLWKFGLLRLEHVHLPRQLRKTRRPTRQLRSLRVSIQQLRGKPTQTSKFKTRASTAPNVIVPINLRN